MTDDEKNKKFPVARFRISEDTRKRLKQKKESQNMTWEEFFLEILKNG